MKGALIGSVCACFGRLFSEERNKLEAIILNIRLDIRSASI